MGVVSFGCMNCRGGERKASLEFLLLENIGRFLLKRMLEHRWCNYIVVGRGKVITS